MNISAFNFISCQPCGFRFALAVLLFAVTGEASGPVARVHHAAGLTRENFPARSFAGIGVIEQAGQARGRLAGTHFQTERRRA